MPMKIVHRSQIDTGTGKVKTASESGERTATSDGDREGAGLSAASETEPTTYEYGDTTSSTGKVSTASESGEDRTVTADWPKAKAVASASNKAVTSADNKSLDDLTVKQLKDRVKAAGVDGYSSMTKSDLIKALS